MGIELLPDELQLSLSQQFPCREAQIRQLSAYLRRSKPSPSTLVLYGPQATGKTALLRCFLEGGKFSHAVVRCRECVSGRQLLERTIGAVREGLIAEQTAASGRRGGGGSRAVELGAQGKCENLGVLLVALQGLMEKRERLLREQGIVDGRGGKFVLVFDGVDVVREAPPTLLPALGRLGEFVPNLTTVLILRHPSPRFLHQTGVPQIHFPPYTREQSIHILSQTPLDIFLSNPSNSNSNNSDNNNPSNNNAYKPREDYDEEVHAEDKAWLWPRFCAAVWDALAQSAARDLAAYREICEKLWRPFLAPVVKGDFGTRDFSRLVVAQRRLFQDEGVLLDSIVAMEGAGGSRSQALGGGVGEGARSSGFLAPAPAPASSTAVATTAGKKARSTDLPYYAKWLLLAAYLASFTPTRMDATFFMKTTERSTSKKRGGGGGGGGGSRGGVGSRGGRGGRAGGGRGGRTPQKSRIPRHLLAPSTFTIDRLLAILHAILPHDLRSTCDVYTQVATLTSLRLLVRSGGIGSSAGGDFLEAGGKWRVGGVVSWEVVVVLARGLGFDIGAYVDY